MFNVHSNLKEMPKIAVIIGYRHYNKDFYHVWGENCLVFKLDSGKLEALEVILQSWLLEYTNNVRIH